MKNKKMIIPALVAFIALAAGALYVPITRAATTTMPLFGTTSLLGVNLLMGNSGGANSMMVLVDFSDAPTTDHTYTLPTVVGKQGQIMILKATNGDPGDTGVFMNIYPTTGQELENDSNKEFYHVPGWGIAPIVLVADPANNTWWVISNS